jgi:ABC-2 type transport system permease protein
MAVYKRNYRPYNGPLTPRWSRFWTIPRYAYQDIFRSRLLALFFFACFIAPVVFGVVIYLLNNLALLQQYGVVGKPQFEIDGDFFFIFLHTQTAMGFLLVAFVGPNLVSPDLTNNALPLYLCRPFGRSEYVAGKIVVLAFLLSQITWIPGLLLWVIQASLAGGAWWRENLWIAWAIFAASWLWIVVLSLLAITMSAWVKWRMAATGLLVGIFFFSAGLAEAVNQVLDTKRGSMFNLVESIETIWGALFRSRLESFARMPVSDACLVLTGVTAVCLWMLSKKIRAREVVKS